ncbi:Fibronectin type III,Fibronectin type III domain-containing protein 5, C-terminal domain,Immunoglobulin- [Cinara cedri]|uniref:Fibronectin type III,Fibronectin type III domain-containing protein 5, C-terminal domain,Immunoglobulin n=1 Tax=Cinara cedri TaxID=506608 RepID=A0A5E4MG34_9HEMI|nr:Fibronectin type III,Fibronectin type III domain-containing protein 5, C-terminal domain,Immunoglobulin- [Cinara cedri]
MILLEIFFILYGFQTVWCFSGSHAPGDITVMFVSPTTVKVSWKISRRGVEKYDVMYKPTNASYRVVAEIAVNSDSVTLGNLMPNTQYQVTVTAFKAGRRFRSRPVIFKTLDKGVSWPDIQRSQMNSSGDVDISPPDVVGGTGHSILPEGSTSPPYVQVRGIEITIVVLVLMVWVGAIIMFFNRWGKIRMLIPYQPDYKDTQLKVPGTGACNPTNSCQNQTGTGFCCSQRHLMRCGLADPLDWRVRNLLRSRSRVNSAIYISPIYQDAHIRNGISVRPVRKAQSADCLPQYDYSGWANCQQYSLSLSAAANAATTNAGGGVCIAGGGVCVTGGGVAGGVCARCGICASCGVCANGGVCASGGGVCASGGGVCASGGGVCASSGSGGATGGVGGIGGTVHQRHIKRFQLPTVSISIASDSDKALNELLI